MRTLLLLGLALLPTLLLGAGCGSDDETPVDYELIWQDEFEGPQGQLPDSSRWRFDVGTDWGNNQLEYDTDRPENVSLDGLGHLRIIARKETYEGEDGTRDYTSGRINTRDLFDAAYGRFEARIRLPIGQGIWPAFWLLGSNFGQVGWPACGEIDIMEYRGQEPLIVHGSLHGPGYSGGNALTGRFVADAANFPYEFHVFAVEWSPGRITWEVDGRAYQTFTPGELPPGTAWVFDHPFFVILNVAVGGNFVGPPNASTSFPQIMLVDWVRVYQARP